jgi:hypothetical protein
MLGGRSQDDLKGRESSIFRHHDAQFRFSADLEQLTAVEGVDVADGDTTIVKVSRNVPGSILPPIVLVASNPLREIVPSGRISPLFLRA